MRRGLVLTLATLAGVTVVAATLALACGAAGFPDSSVIGSVRILASRSDQPFAKPGATVRSEVLVVDGRPDAATNEPLRVFWLPFVCINPPNDAYYACFSEFEQNPSSVEQYGAAGAGGHAGTTATISGAISSWDGGADAGVAPSVGLSLFGDGGAQSKTDGGLLGAIPAGKDISAFLVQGPRAVFHLPTTIISSHPPVAGSTPYGVAVLINIACAGHVELIALDPTNPSPEQIPFGCFNTQGVQLGADSYVLGYTEIFAYESLTNTNPVISSFSFGDAAVPLDGGGGATGTITVTQCPTGAKTCPDSYAIVGVPDASWARDPQNLGPDGGELGEQIWVDYYATLGTLSEEAILIFDPTRGRVVPPHQEDFQTSSKGSGTLWAVVHDNRGGASWLTIPVRSK